MILIELEIVCMNKKRDVRTDENILTDQLIRELADTVCRIEQCELAGDEKELMLWNSSTETFLRNEYTLKENGVKGGETLLLI